MNVEMNVVEHYNGTEHVWEYVLTLYSNFKGTHKDFVLVASTDLYFQTEPLTEAK